MPIPKSPIRKPAKDVECIALVKPDSPLAKTWQFNKPVYGMYAYDGSFDRHELRFGDGTWQRLIEAQLQDILLLEHYGPELVEALFD